MLESDVVEKHGQFNMHFTPSPLKLRAGFFNSKNFSASKFGNSSYSSLTGFQSKLGLAEGITMFSLQFRYCFFTVGSIVEAIGS